MSTISSLHPSNPSFRWVFLVFLCFLTFGSYWCYDIPGALQIPLETHLKINGAQFALLYSVYNFMNIVVVLFGGLFIDKIGLRLGSILFCLLIGLGQLVVSFGVGLSNVHTAFIVMIIGRIIFSLGGESLSVAQSTYCSKWFKGKELALSFGITLSFSRIGSFTNLWVTPRIDSASGLTLAVWVGTFMCAISLFVTLLAAVSDRLRDNVVKSKEEVSAATPFNIRDVLKFPLSIWLLYGICVFFYIGIFILVSVSGVPFLAAIYGVNNEKGMATSILSIPYFMSAILAPIAGFTVDRVGRKPLWLFVSSCLMIAAYATMMLFPKHVHIGGWPLGPILAMAIMGLSYSLCAASLWPCVPFLVDDSIVGTAYAIMNSIQNAGLGLASEGAPLLLVHCNASPSACAYRPLLFIGGVSIIAAMLSIWLGIEDKKRGGVLSRRSAQIKATGPSETEPLLQ